MQELTWCHRRKIKETIVKKMDRALEMKSKRSGCGDYFLRENGVRSREGVCKPLRILDFTLRWKLLEQ